MACSTSSLREVVGFCREVGINSAVFFFPGMPSESDLAWLESQELCLGFVINSVSGGARTVCQRTFLQAGFVRTRAKGTAIFVGPQLMITRELAFWLMRLGYLTVVCDSGRGYQRFLLPRFFVWVVGEKLYSAVNSLPSNGILRKSLYEVAALGGIHRLWARWFKRKAGHDSLSGLEQLCDSIFKGASSICEILPDRSATVADRIILINAGLAPGGAERQIINTVIGLANVGRCESVALLLEYIGRAPGLDFFLPELQGVGVEVCQVVRRISLAKQGLASLPSEVAALVAKLPSEILEDVLNLIEEFRVRRPTVVHAWQDASSIRVGIAAVIAGVPKIVLGSRNVIPVNFSYYRDYMRPIYRALARLQSVVFINNSDAGASDYTAWLGLPRERFKVIRNGVNLASLRRAEGVAMQDYRSSLNIPDGALIVGAVFRFWPEKRPLLWLSAAKLIAKDHPSVHFLLIGDGPLRSDMEAFVRDAGLDERVHMPGARSDIALPVSCMSVFLMTSEYEGTPNVVLEAQWLGLPCVITDAGGAKEAILPNVTGSVISTPDPVEISRHVSYFLSDDKARQRAELMGPRQVSERYSCSEMVQATLAAYAIQ